MRRHIVKPIVVGVLCCVLMGLVGCSSEVTDRVIKGSLCAAAATATIVVAIADTALGESLTVPLLFYTADRCTDAFEAFVEPSATTPQATTYVVISPPATQTKDISSVSYQTTLPANNCASSTPLVNESITIQAGFKIILTVGTEQFTSRPADSNTDPMAMIARQLIDKYGIAVGTNLNVPITAVVSLPAHTQAIVQLPSVTVTVAAGLAAVVQGTPTPTSSTNGIQWSYPTKIEAHGNPIVGTPSLC